MHCPRKSSLQARRNTRFTAFYAGVENYRSDLLKGYGPFPQEDRPDSGDPAKSLTFPKRTIAVRATAFSTCRPPLALSRASRTSTAECCNGSTGTVTDWRHLRKELRNNRQEQARLRAALSFTRLTSLRRIDRFISLSPLRQYLREDGRRLAALTFCLPRHRLLVFLCIPQ